MVELSRVSILTTEQLAGLQRIAADKGLRFGHMFYRNLKIVFQSGKPYEAIQEGSSEWDGEIVKFEIRHRLA